MNERFFHGGVPGLKVGNELLPPSRTGALSCADLVVLAVKYPSRRDRVYASRSLEVARVYAALRPGQRGDLYEVELEAPIEDDRVFGDSVCAPFGRVVRVVERCVSLDVAAHAMAALRDQLEQEVHA